MHCLRTLWLWTLEWTPYILPALANGVLVFLGVWLSLPDFAQKVQDNPAYRKLLAGVCITLGLIWMTAEIRSRRDSDKANSQLLRDVGTALIRTNELLTNTHSLMTSTASIAAFENTAIPQLAGLQTNIAHLHDELDAAKEKHDPELIRDLEAKAQAAHEQAHDLSRELLAVTMAPQVAAQLRDWDAEKKEADLTIGNEEWEEKQQLKDARNASAKPLDWTEVRKQSDQKFQTKLKSIVTTADFIRKEMLQRIPSQAQNREDREQEREFALAKNSPDSLDRNAAANYILGLAS